jgi:predicted component of type VI protein secretion system
VVVLPAQQPGASSTNESLTTKGAGALTSPNPRKSCVSTSSGPSSAPALPVSESAAIALEPLWATQPRQNTRFLKTASGTDTVEYILLDQSLHYVVGREQIGPNRVVDSHETVSRDHAVITFLDEMVFVKDLVSTNGTHIGGFRIEEGLEFVPLFDKDWVRFGKSSIGFCLCKPTMSVIQTRLLNTITNLFSKTHKDIHTL